MKKSKKFAYLEPWNLPTPEELTEAQDYIVKIMEDLNIEGNYDLKYIEDGGPSEIWVKIYLTINDEIEIEKIRDRVNNKLDKVFDFNPKGMGKFCVLASIKTGDESKKHYKDRIDF